MPPLEFDPTLPFTLVSPLTPASRAAITEAALAANSRYVEGFLEKNNYCPFARQGRESGATDRMVHLAESADLAPLLAYFDRAAADDTLEVVQVLFPLLDAEPGPFVRFVQDLTQYANNLIEGPDVFAPAAFHPHLPYRGDTPLTLIPLLRRAPDPGIQWTRNTVLARIYDGRRGGKVFINLANVEELLKRPPPRDLFDDISNANHARAKRASFDTVEAQLSTVHVEAQAEYQRILERP